MEWAARHPEASFHQHSIVWQGRGTNTQEILLPRWKSPEQVILHPLRGQSVTASCENNTRVVISTLERWQFGFPSHNWLDKTASFYSNHPVPLWKGSLAIPSMFTEATRTSYLRQYTCSWKVNSTFLQNHSLWKLHVVSFPFKECCYESTQVQVGHHPLQICFSDLDSIPLPQPISSSSVTLQFLMWL